MKAFKAFIKPFEAPQRSVKIKIQVKFVSSSGIGTGKVNNMWSVFKRRYSPGIQLQRDLKQSTCEMLRL